MARQKDTDIEYENTVLAKDISLDPKLLKTKKTMARDMNMLAKEIQRC